MSKITQYSKKDESKINQEIDDILNLVLTYAKEQGATGAAVAVDQDRGFSVDVRMQEVDTIAFHEGKSVSVSAYMGHHKGSASSTDISKNALKEMVSAAIDICKVSAEDPCFSLPDSSLFKKEYPDLVLCHRWDIDPQEAIKIALDCEKEALSLDKRIHNSDGVHLSTHCFVHGFANTQGFMGIVHSSRHNMSCSLIAKSGALMQRDYDYTMARDPLNLLNTKQLATNAVKRAVSRLDAKKINTQKVPVLFSSRISGHLFSAFISAISGSNLYRKKYIFGEFDWHEFISFFCKCV